ncbi:MAG: ferritin [Muribaculaceae bacterium]|nr:ferritin [Muribaculaceae bacterium]
MFQKKIEDALNEQINAELWSAYLYLSMSLHFQNVGRPGIANWYYIQFQEEQAHALALMNYVNARDGKVLLKPIEEVPTSWDSTLAAFEATLEHEKKVTAKINNLYAMAEDAKDFATRQKLNTFVAEQVEEEETVRQIIDDLSLVGEDGTGLLQIDRELGARTFTAPNL